MPHTPTLEVEIEASYLENAEAFEAARQEAYAADESERSGRLRLLGNSAKVAGGLALYDVAMEKLTHVERATELHDAAINRFEEMSERIASTETRRKHTETTYRLSIDPSGEITGISKIEPVKEDKKLTQRSQRIADQTGYGPKMNGSSFRTSSVDAHRRRG